MKKLSTHGDFPVEAIEKAKHELTTELDFAEQSEPSKRSGAGYPSLGGFVETHFDFGEEPVSNFYTSDLRRLRDALKIAENNVAKGYSYGSHERVAELRAKMRDLLGQHMRNLAAAQSAAGDPVGKPDNCCTGEPGHGPTGVKVHTDNRGALIPEYREEEPEWSKEVYDSMQRAAAINEEIQKLYKDYEHEVRMMRYDKAATMFTRIRTLSEDFRNAYPVSDFQWDKDLRTLEIKMHDAPSYEARLPLQNAYMKLQNRYYKDFKGMPMPDIAAQGYVPTYSEDGQEATFDFTRCQRSDGSYYGTGGQCRKGTEAPKPEKEKKSKKEKGGGGTAAEGKKEAKELLKAMGGSFEEVGERATDYMIDAAETVSEGGSLSGNNAGIQYMVEEKLAELDNDPYEAGQAVVDELASNGFVGTIDIYAIGTGGRSLESDMESLQSAYEKQGMSPKKAKDKVDDWYDNWLYQ